MRAIQRFRTFDGTVDLITGQDRGSVVFSDYKGYPPRSVRLTVSDNAGMNISATVVTESITRYGFNFELSAQMTADGGKLNYLCEI